MWWQLHAVKTVSNQSLKNWAGFLFRLESDSKSRHSSTKSEQMTSHHSLRTSSTTTDPRGHFILHRWFSSRNLLWKVRLVAAIFHYITAKTWANLPDTVRSIETLGSFRTQLNKHVFELSFLSNQTIFSAPTNSLLHMLYNQFNFLTYSLTIQTCVCIFLNPLITVNTCHMKSVLPFHNPHFFIIYFTS